MNKIAVIVLHFGKKQDTFECLKSLANIKSKNAFKTFIVDNGTNTLKDKELKTILPQFQLIISPKNLGFSGGNNLALKRILKEKFDYILILNNDVIVNANLIDELIKPFKNTAIGITGSLITYYSEPNKIWFGGGYLDKTFCFTKHTNMNKNIDNNIPSTEVDFITGAVMMIKKEVLENIKFFNEKYFLYWEDVDFCFKAGKLGYKSYFVNKPLVLHKVSASTGIKGTNKLSSIQAYYYARNPFIFIKKNKLNKWTGFIGQLFIRTPYYFLKLENFASFKDYLKGLKDGILFLIKG